MVEDGRRVLISHYNDNNRSEHEHLARSVRQPGLLSLLNRTVRGIAAGPWK